MLALLLALGTAHAVDVPHTTFTLDNGLQVVLIPDRSLPKVVVDVWYDVGSYDDPPGRSGFAHLFEHLMFKGTPRVGEGQFDSLMEQAGGWNNASTSDERTNYFDVGPSSALELLLWLEADRMTSLDITQEKLDVEREVVRNERRQNYEDRPYGWLWLALPEALFPPDNPLHRSGIGSHDELMAATVQDVTDFYKTWYVPSNAVLAVAGDFEVEPIRATIEELFGPLPTRPKPERKLVPMPTEPAFPGDYTHDEVSATLQTFACHAPKAFAPGDAELDVLAHVLAGSPDARLTRALVYTNQVRSVDVSMWSGRWSSVFVIQIMHHPSDATMEGAMLGLTSKNVSEELASLVGDRPPTQVEIDRAVRNLERDAIEGVETLLGRAERLQRYRQLTGRFDYIDEDLARYRTVTPQGVVEQAQHFVQGSKLTDGPCTELLVLPPRPDEPGPGTDGGAP